MPTRRLVSSKIRHEVLARSGHQCAMCGRPSGLELAHVVPLGEGGDSSTENMVALCRSCHRALHTNPTMSVAELKPQRSQAYEFEQLVADHLHRLGYAVLRGATGPDGGVDVVARCTSGLGPMLFVVECKTSSRALPKEQIERFAQKVSEYGATGGVIFTTAPLTPSAAEAARAHGVSVWGPDDLRNIGAKLGAHPDG